jgi:beta-lactamase superfamily II metal-dependent hydrolase
MTGRDLKTQRKRLFINFTFHNVGEGLFYSGQIGDFNFVYDCGVLRSNRNHLDSAISNYVNRKLRNRRVDLLIISHLHEDHISGLDTLLNKVRVDTVILPYLSPIERLVVALRNVNLSKWLYSFWSDPITFFLDEKEVNKVILVGGHDPYPVEEMQFEGGEEGIDVSKMPEDEDLKKEIIKNERQLGIRLKRFFDNGKLLAKNHRGYLTAKGVWLFRFFNCRVKDSNMNLFKQCLDAKSIMQHYDLISIIRSNSLLRQLKNCYEKLHGDFNNTSLVVYHAPIAPSKSILFLPCHYSTYTVFIHPYRFYARFMVHGNETIGQFLTGDVNLNAKWTDIEKHYGGCLSRVGLALVPHHGSSKNWNRAILAKTPHKCLWVTSASISNKYHPSFKVIKDINCNGSIHLGSNELSEISIRHTILLETARDIAQYNSPMRVEILERN